MGEYNVITTENVVTCGDTRRDVAPIITKLTQNDSLYIAFKGPSESSGDCIEPPNRVRNFASIDRDCKLSWHCQEIPDKYIDELEVPFHRIIVPNFEGNPITRGPDRRFFEFDSESGEFLDSWAASQFKIDGEFIELSNGIDHIDISDSKYIMQCMDGSDTRIICFSKSGELCWDRHLERDWSFFVREDYVYVVHGHYSRRLSFEDGSTI